MPQMWDVWALGKELSILHIPLQTLPAILEGERFPRRKKGSKKTPGRRATFMTDFSDDSDGETHCVEVYGSTADEDEKTLCLVDCATTHVILKDRRFFKNIDSTLAPSNIKTIGGRTSIARGAGQAEVSLPNGTIIKIDHAIYAPMSSRNLLSYSDLRKNGFHICTSTDQDGCECLLLLDRDGRTVEKFLANERDLYTTYIDPTQNCNASFLVEDSEELPISAPLNKFNLWHDRLGHPSSGTLRKMAYAIIGMPLKPSDASPNNLKVCPACVMGKTPNRKKTAFSNERYKPHEPLEMLVSDVCGPILPRSGPFSYFMIIKDVSTRYSQVHLLTSRNEVMPKLLTAIIQLKAQFPQLPIKSIRVDNASEYVSKSFQGFVHRPVLRLRRMCRTHTTLMLRTS